MKAGKTFIGAAGLIIAGLGLAGCRAGPTYGTGKTSGEQFVEDMSNLVTLKSSVSDTRVDSKPRPELVRPRAGEQAVLPPPQQAAARAGNPDWPESPEERRQRLRNEATANRDNPNYVSPVVQDNVAGDKRYLPNGVDRVREREDMMPNAAVSKKQLEEFRRRKKESEGGVATQRKYLSEPPLEYRQPAPTAPIGDLGKDESKKERAAKKKK